VLSLRLHDEQAISAVADIRIAMNPGFVLHRRKIARSPFLTKLRSQNADIGWHALYPNALAHALCQGHSTGSGVRSSRGDRPNLRKYSRENCAELSYPTLNAISDTFALEV
jgi:hypothetical protein